MDISPSPPIPLSPTGPSGVRPPSPSRSPSPASNQELQDKIKHVRFRSLSMSSIHDTPLRLSISPSPSSSPRSPISPIKSPESPTSKRPKDVALDVRHDLKTPSTPEAIAHSFKVAAALIAVESHLEGIPLSETSPQKSPFSQFNSMIKSFKELIEKSDMNDDGDRQILQKIRQLLTKSFSPTAGGIGFFQKRNDWDPKWDGLFAKDSLPEQYHTDKEELVKMIAYFENHLSKQLPSLGDKGTFDYSKVDKKIDKNKIDQTIIQLEAFTGQILNDVLFEEHLSARNKLKEILIKNKVFIADFDQVVNFRNLLRGNALLAEHKQDKILPDIRKALTPLIRQQLEMVLLDKASTFSVDGQLDKRLKSLDRLTKSVVDLITYTPIISKMGQRGRAPDFDKTGAIGKALKGLEKEDWFTSMPNNKEDVEAYNAASKLVKDKLGNKVDVGRFKKNLNQITAHHGSPSVVLRLGSALETELHDFLLNPEKQVLRALKMISNDDTIDQEGREIVKELLDAYTGEEADKLAKNLKKSMQDVVISYNSNNPAQKMTINQLAEQPTIASIMADNDLRIICSISGTTTDILLAQFSQLGITGTKKLLQPLLDHALRLKEAASTPGRGVKNLKFKPPANATAKEIRQYEVFKTFFAKVTFFMQSGQYHSAAEVLGGLLVGASSLSKIDHKEIVKIFGYLMENFAAHPENYFPLSEKEKDTLFMSIGMFKSIAALKNKDRELAAQNVAASEATGTVI